MTPLIFIMSVKLYYFFKPSSKTLLILMRLSMPMRFSTNPQLPWILRPVAWINGVDCWPKSLVLPTSSDWSTSKPNHRGNPEGPPCFGRRESRTSAKGLVSSTRKQNSHVSRSTFEWWRFSSLHHVLFPPSEALDVRTDVGEGPR